MRCETHDIFRTTSIADAPNSIKKTTSLVALSHCDPGTNRFDSLKLDSRPMASPQKSHAHTYRVFLAFACLYIFWGGTYTAIHFGVAHVPPPVLAGTRLGISGCILLAFSALCGNRIFASMREMRRVFLLGVLLLFVGNIALMWAEKYLPSGLSALLVAIIPVDVALIELALPHGERLRFAGRIGLAMGFAGLAILAWPSARAGLHGDRHQIFAIAILMFSSFSFACGSVLARNSNLSLNPFTCAGWEMIAASACNLALASCLGEWNATQWGRDSLTAIGYLIVFGSLVGFSCYSWLLQNVPVTKLATYAYVNPIVAVLLGAWIIGERLHGNEWIGMIVILVAVVLVTSSKMQGGHGAPEVQMTTLSSET